MGGHVFDGCGEFMSSPISSPTNPTLLKCAPASDTDFGKTTDDYDQLIGNMHHNDRLVPDEVAMPVTVLRALTGAVPYIDVVHHRALLSSQLHTSFQFPRDIEAATGLAKKDQVIIRVHLALKGIADLVPLAPSRLEQIVRERVPNVFSKEAVEIGWDEILLDDPSSKGIFEMELEDMARPVDETEMDVDEPQKKYSGRKVLWGNVVAQKLDALMDLTFDHLQSCFKNGRLHQVFKALLQSFQSTVLNAYKSKFVQAVMYVICFRMRSILATFQLKSQLLNMPLEQIFKHPLDPLEVCLPSIVEEFLHQAKAAGLFSVSDDTFVFHHLLESDMSRAFGGFHRLDVSFPFDPYLLKSERLITFYFKFCDCGRISTLITKIIRRFIRPNFIYWSMVRPTYDDEEDDCSINDEDDGDDDYDVDQQERKMQMPSRIRPSTSPKSL
ncbi:hypothetical protein R6Q57_027678 [Mikania cordata]